MGCEVGIGEGVDVDSAGNVALVGAELLGVTRETDDGVAAGEELDAEVGAAEAGRADDAYCEGGGWWHLEGVRC